MKFRYEEGREEESISDWHPIETAPADQVVMTRIDDQNGIRNTQLMKRQDHLWWVASGSMYVYYTPTHWRVATFQELQPVRDRAAALAKLNADDRRALGVSS